MMSCTVVSKLAANSKNITYPDILCKEFEYAVVTYPRVVNPRKPEVPSGKLKCLTSSKEIQKLIAEMAKNEEVEDRPKSAKKAPSRSESTTVPSRNTNTPAKRSVKKDDPPVSHKKETEASNKARDKSAQRTAVSKKVAHSPDKSSVKGFYQSAKSIKTPAPRTSSKSVKKEPMRGFEVPKGLLMRYNKPIPKEDLNLPAILSIKELLDINIKDFEWRAGVKIGNKMSFNNLLESNEKKPRKRGGSQSVRKSYMASDDENDEDDDEDEEDDARGAHQVRLGKRNIKNLNLKRKHLDKFIQNAAKNLKIGNR